MSNKGKDVVEEASLESFPAGDPPAWTADPRPSAVRQPAPDSAADILQDGVIAGVIGYLVVAVFFGAASMLRGESFFHIADLLGRELFFGGGGVDRAVEPGPAIAYNGVHLAVFMVAGVFMAWLASIAARTEQGWYLGLSLLIYVGAHVVVVPVWFDEHVTAVLSLWLITAATSAAAIAMAVYLWMTHPGIRASMHEPDE